MPVWSILRTYQQLWTHWTDGVLLSPQQKPKCPCVTVLGLPKGHLVYGLVTYCWPHRSSREGERRLQRARLHWHFRQPNKAVPILLRVRHRQPIQLLLKFGEEWQDSFPDTIRNQSSSFKSIRILSIKRPRADLPDTKVQSKRQKDSQYCSLTFQL